MEKTWQQLKNQFDNFCVKNGFKTAILGLSGGLDSALCAVLAAEVLGGKNVTAVMMKTIYTSPLSLEIAREIARLNNLSYHEHDIQPMIDNETSFLRHAFGCEPTCTVLENLQARTRGKILMAWSNQFGGLVIACSNKSETATGYCTLYGDTCGGVMPLGNLYKSQIFKLAQWRNNQNWVLPSEVIVRAPSAELAPNQKDENFLPPYNLLDQILNLYIDQKLSPQDIIAQGYDKDMVDFIVAKYWSSEFKRRQMSPALVL